MSDEPKKPRKVKDLKARLGRTIAPSTVKAGGDGIAPPPNLGGGGVVPPPSSVGGGPPAGLLGSAKPKVAAPPFLQQEEEKKKKSGDPFAAGEAASGPQQVRIVLDGEPVDDSEVGRAAVGKMAVFALIAAVIGGGLAVAIKGLMHERAERDQQIANARTILESEREASEAVQTAVGLVDRLINKANVTRTGGAEVDYEALQALRAIPRPQYNVTAFANVRFDQFATAAAPIINYHMLLEKLFAKIEHMGRYLLTTRRPALDEAAAAASGAANDSLSRPTTGCVPTVTNRQLYCNMVFVDWPTTTPTEPITKIPTHAARRAPASQRPEKTIFHGYQQSLAENPSQFVIITNSDASRGVLGATETIFVQYQRDLAELRELLNGENGIINVQGTLETQLGSIVSLEGS